MRVNLEEYIQYKIVGASLQKYTNNIIEEVLLLMLLMRDRPTARSECGRLLHYLGKWATVVSEIDKISVTL